MLKQPALNKLHGAHLLEIGETEKLQQQCSCQQQEVKASTSKSKSKREQHSRQSKMKMPKMPFERLTLLAGYNSQRSDNIKQTPLDMFGRT